MNARLEGFAEDFQALPEWEDRYGLIMDLGRDLPSYPDSLRCEATRVHGCQSQVWLTQVNGPRDDYFYFLADSDSLIVRGLIAIVHRLLNARPPAEVLAEDMSKVFEVFGLEAHLTPGRRNGLRNLVSAIKQLAATKQQTMLGGEK